MKNSTFNEDLYEYGKQVLKDHILFFFVTLCISIVLDITPEFILFYLFFYPLRTNLGGFHFNDKYICFVFSVIVSIFLSYLIKVIYIPSQYTMVIIIISFYLAYKLKCTDHPNKKLSENEKNYFTTKSLKIILFDTLVFLIASYSHLILISNTISIVLLFVTLNNMLGKWLNRHT